MLNLPFTISPLEIYDRYITNYKGLDLSFLGLNVTKYINSWAMPVTHRTIDDREISIVYSTGDLTVANEIAKTAELFSEDLYLKSNKNENDIAQARLISATCDAFSSRITVTLRLLLESGFIHQTKIKGSEHFFIRNESNDISGTLDWKVSFHPLGAFSESTEPVDVHIMWSIEGELAPRFKLTLKGNKGEKLEFDTKQLNKSTYGDMLLPNAIFNNKVRLSGNLIPDFSVLHKDQKITFSCDYVKTDSNINWTFFERKLLI